MFDPSHFVTIGVSGLAGGVWWLAGYQKLSRTRGWESLQVRFSPVNGRIILASALVGLILICLSWGVAEILEMAGIGIKALPPQAILPSNLRELPLAIAVVVVLVPLSEELIFRGLLLDWLKPKVEVRPAALVISLIFAFLHNISF
jgi:membrane protease YdiL (CAAX protease family)